MLENQYYRHLHYINLSLKSDERAASQEKLRGKHYYRNNFSVVIFASSRSLTDQDSIRYVP